MFETEKFHFTTKNRARTVKLFRGEKYIEICTSNMWENFFGEAVRHSSKLFVVKKGDKNLSYLKFRKKWVLHACS